MINDIQVYYKVKQERKLIPTFYIVANQNRVCFFLISLNRHRIEIKCAYYTVHVQDSNKHAELLTFFITRLDVGGHEHARQHERS